MKRIAFVVEGLTEVSFVNRVLKAELADAALILYNLKGGAISVKYVLKHITPLLHDNFDCITTMVDYYGFRNPGRKSGAGDIERELAEAVNAINRSDIVFLPYLQRHEFEALLFADRRAIAEHLRLDGGQKKQLKNIGDDPEDINHKMPPSKRLCGIHPRYDKRLDGIEIIRKIGLARIEKACPHFAEWLAKLRKMAKQ